MNTHTEAQATETVGSPEVDPVRMQMFMQEIKNTQNLLLGGIAGVGAAATGAIIWAAVTALTGYQIGWMAVGVGFLVGVAVRIFGKGIDKVFGIVGGVLSLTGCLAGNLLTVCIMVSRQEHIDLLDLLSRLNPEITSELMRATFSPIDLLFYGIAVYEGYKFSFRSVTEDEFGKLVQ
jgi:hypothetical protein